MERDNRRRRKGLRRGAMVVGLVAATAIGLPAAAQEAEADTTETLENIEARLLGELGEADSAAAAVAPPSAQSQGTLNPDLSLIADFVIDLSPDGSTLEDGDRLRLREIEIGIQGAVDPYFRYDAFIAVEGEAVEIEEAYATTLALPAGLQVKLGRMLLPFGKVNLTHVPELDTIELPLVHQLWFGEEGLRSTGVWTSVLGAPLGFFQELSVLATNGAEVHGHDGEEDEDHAEDEAGKSLGDDLADRLYVAHLKNSFDLTEAANLELGASWSTGAVDEPERSRTNLYGLDAIWRWKPPQRATYRSAILQAEVAWRNEAGTGETLAGGFVFGQWQLGRRTYLGARYDVVEPIEEGEGTLQAGQVLVRFFPTEFSQLRLGYERQVPDEGDAIDRILFQTTFGLGPHRPHPY